MACATRFILYEMATGELKAIMDAQYLTTLRTGATSAVASKRLTRKGSLAVGVIGSGKEAVGTTAGDGGNR